MSKFDYSLRKKGKEDNSKFYFGDRVKIIKRIEKGEKGWEREWDKDYEYVYRNSNEAVVIRIFKKETIEVAFSCYKTATQKAITLWFPAWNLEKA